MHRGNAGPSYEAGYMLVHSRQGTYADANDHSSHATVRDGHVLRTAESRCQDCGLNSDENPDIAGRTRNTHLRLSLSELDLCLAHKGAAANLRK